MFQKSSRALTLGVLALSLSGCFTEEVDHRQIKELQGLFYKVHDTEPFSGRISNYPMSVLGMFSVGSCSIEVRKGLPHGEMSCHDNEGNLAARQTFEAGKRHGREEKYDVKRGELTHRNNWRENRQHGRQEQFNPANGERIAEVNYSEGKKDGRERYWDASGETLLTDFDWQDGLASGFDNRGSNRRTMRNGKEHGLQQDYDLAIDGRYYLGDEENYDNGQRHGLQRTFDAAGNILRERLYEQGVLRSETTREYEQGRQRSQLSKVQRDDAPDRWDQEESLLNDGLEQRWDDAGNLTYEVRWNRGKVVDAVRNYWVDGALAGQLQGIGQDGYDDNQRVLKHGIERLYNDRGELRAAIQWSQGKGQFAAIPLPTELQAQHPGKLGIIEKNDRDAGYDIFGRLVAYSPDLAHDSRYEAGFGPDFIGLMDIPTADAQLIAVAQGPSQEALDACVQARVDAVHAEDPEALIRYDMLQEFESECR